MGYLTDSALDLGTLRGRLRPWTGGNYTAVTANYTVLPTDGTVSVDTTAGAVVLTLPSAAAVPGKTLRIVKTASAAYGVTVQRAGSDTILPSNGSRTSFTFPSGCSTGEVMMFSTGSAWYVASGQASDETVGRRLWKWEQSLAATSTTAAVGFQMIYADTGWRDLAASLSNSWTASKLLVRRVGDTVRLRGIAMNGSAASSGTIITLASGLRPADALYGVWASASQTGLPAHSGTVSTAGVTALGGTYTGVTAGEFNWSWSTSDSWLASLPGTASGTIPT